MKLKHTIRIFFFIFILMSRIETLSLFCDKDSNRWLFIYYFYLLSKSNYDQQFFLSYCNIVKIASKSVEKKVKRTLVILHYFASCEIMRLTNRFMEFKKEFQSLQALAVLIYLDPVDMYNIFDGTFFDFSRILAMLKGKHSFIKKGYLKLIIFQDDVQI